MIAPQPRGCSLSIIAGPGSLPYTIIPTQHNKGCLQENLLFLKKKTKKTKRLSSTCNQGSEDVSRRPPVWPTSWLFGTTSHLDSVSDIYTLFNEELAFSQSSRITSISKSFFFTDAFLPSYHLNCDSNRPNFESTRTARCRPVGRNRNSCDVVVKIQPLKYFQAIRHNLSSRATVACSSSGFLTEPATVSAEWK